MNSLLSTTILFGLSVCLSGCAVMKGSNPLGRMMHQRDAVAGMEQDPFASSIEGSSALVAGAAPAASAAQPLHAAGVPAAAAVPPGTTIPHASPGVRQIGALPPAQPATTGSCTLTDGGPGVAGNSRFAGRPAPLQAPAGQPTGRVRLTGTAPPAPQGVVPVAWAVEAPAAPPAANSAAAAAFPAVPQPLIPEPARRLAAAPAPPAVPDVTPPPQRLMQTASVAAPFPEMPSTAKPVHRPEAATPAQPMPRAATSDTATAAPFPDTAAAAADAVPAAETPRKPRARSNVQPTALLERTANAPESTKPTGTVSKSHHPASPRLLGRAQAAGSSDEPAPGGNPFEPAGSAAGPDAVPLPATEETWKPAGSTPRTSDSTDYWPAPVPADAPAN